MRLQDVLGQVPGADKRFVYYLESQGVIRPTRVPKSRIDRRDYSEGDVGQIRRVWRYYRRGYALAAARELADREVGAEAYALLVAPPRAWQAVLGALAESDRLVEAAVVYGERLNVVARLEAARDEEVYEALHPAFDRGVLGGPLAILHGRPSPAGLSNRGAAGRTVGMMRAFVLLTVPAKHVDVTLRSLSDLEGVVEASAVYGETDIIAKVEVPGQAELDQLVFHQVQGLPEVEATRTFIVVGGLHWTRDDG
jgi:DNA-binding Lrp family transcriptional regulator